MSRHVVQSWDEHGISWRRYSSRTIFWTLPDFNVRRYVLLLSVVVGVVEAYERLRLVMLAIVTSAVALQQSRLTSSLL